MRNIIANYYYDGEKWSPEARTYLSGKTFRNIQYTENKLIIDYILRRIYGYPDVRNTLEILYEEIENLKVAPNPEVFLLYDI